MKKLLLSLITLTATSAFAAPHCPPGQNNVWGACINRGAGVVSPVTKRGHIQRRPVAKAKKGCAIRRAQTPRVPAYPGTEWNRPHCPPHQVNVWGACVDRTDSGQRSGWGW